MDNTIDKTLCSLLTTFREEKASSHRFELLYNECGKESYLCKDILIEVCRTYA